MRLSPYLHMCGSQYIPAPWRKEEINSFSQETWSTEGQEGYKRELGFVSLFNSNSAHPQGSICIQWKPGVIFFWHWRPASHSLWLSTLFPCGPSWRDVQRMWLINCCQSHVSCPVSRVVCSAVPITPGQHSLLCQQHEWEGIRSGYVPQCCKKTHFGARLVSHQAVTPGSAGAPGLWFTGQHMWRSVQTWR